MPPRGRLWAREGVCFHASGTRGTATEVGKGAPDRQQPGTGLLLEARDHPPSGPDPSRKEGQEVWAHLGLRTRTP